MRQPPHLKRLKDRSDENIPGAAPKPSVTILNETTDGALLQCVVLGASPKPSVQWKDRAGNILPAEEPQVTKNRERYDTILQTTVTKANHYRCVSTQMEIYHQIYADIYVPISEPHTGWSNPAIIGIITGLVGLVGLVGFLGGVAYGSRKKHRALNSNPSRPSDAGSPLYQSNGSRPQLNQEASFT